MSKQTKYVTVKLTLTEAIAINNRMELLRENLIITRGMALSRALRKFKAALQETDPV
jgi:hypothetical protein